MLRTLRILNSLSVKKEKEFESHRYTRILTVLSKRLAQAGVVRAYIPVASVPYAFS